MNYFEDCQQIKTEIESSGLLRKVKEAFSGNIVPFANGGSVNLYRIGNLESGHHIALRLFKLKGEGQWELPQQKRLMEYYCQHAEALNEDGYRAPLFTIGVLDPKRAGVITEDLTKGGAVNLEHDPNFPYGWIRERGKDIKVFIDIDYWFQGSSSYPYQGIIIENPKYFSPGKFIQL